METADGIDRLEDVEDSYGSTTSHADGAGDGETPDLCRRGV